MPSILQEIEKDFKRCGIDKNTIDKVIEDTTKWLSKIKKNTVIMCTDTDNITTELLDIIYRKADDFMIQTLSSEDQNHPFIPLFKKR